MPHSPSLTLHRARTGFTLVEIVVLLIIIALMLVIIVPHFLNQWTVRKADRVKADLVTLNAAIEHYALDNGKVAGSEVNYTDIRKYLDPNTDAYHQNGRDVFGDTYGPFAVGSRPAVPPKTADRLSELVGQDYWSPFQ
jgi:type II secretory pathway pseudopilin PulG